MTEMTTIERKPRTTKSPPMFRSHEPVEPTRHVKRRHPPEDETARQKFLRLANARTVNALHAIRLIGNLSSTVYDYKEDDVAFIHNSILQQIEDTFGKFRQNTSAPKLEEVFKLED